MAVRRHIEERNGLGGAGRDGRAGMTLMELLVVMSILAIISSLAVVTLRSVRDDARKSRTRSVIEQVRSALDGKLKTFETRQMPINFDREFPLNPVNGEPISWGQRRFVMGRTVVEWVRAEMPAYQEYLIRIPSLESQQAQVSTFRNGRPAEEQPDFWPNQWVAPYVLKMSTMSAPNFFAPIFSVRASTDNLIEADVSGSNQYLLVKENPNLTPAQLAASIVESSELLYQILHNTIDEQGNRGTHYLTPEDLDDVDGDRFPEIIDGAGFPLVFSVIMRGVDENGLPIDWNGDGVNDFRDLLLEPRVQPTPTTVPPRAPTLNDINFTVFSIYLDEFPPYLNHLRNADFSGFTFK